jgi:uncharacterized repeat protein (TIGR01451 family)
MGKLFGLLRYAPKRTAALIAVLVAAVVVPATLLAWGPGRPTFTEQNPASYITFNSITDNSVYGDERLFATIKDASDYNGSWKDEVVAEPGKEYVVRMYVHNNAAKELNLVAKNVRASAAISKETGKENFISAFISADNANPQKIWDDVKLTSNKNFNLVYVPGSATWHNNGVGSAPEGAKLSDNIVTSTGALLGHTALNGEMPGCYEYSGFVYFRVKPQFAEQPNYTIEKKVSKHGANKWVENYEAKPGETVDYLINYKNTGDSQLDNVVIKDMLPNHIKYVKGSSVLGNSHHPNGIKTDDGVTVKGLNVGSYKPGANAWIIFSAKVAGKDKLPCGKTNLNNVARVTVNDSYKEDNAHVIVKRVCQPGEKPPTELPKTGVDSGIIAIAGMGISAAGAAYAATSSRLRDLIKR